MSFRPTDPATAVSPSLTINFCADWLANQACNLPIGLHQLEEPPRGILQLILANNSRVVIPRNIIL